MDNNYLKFHIEKDVKSLYKSFLLLIEDLEQRGYKFNEDDFKYIRKKILDKGNETIRELEIEVDKFDIKLKE